jgi:heme/copper-type cytochrome/quinol oxidase subunit 2
MKLINKSIGVLLIAIMFIMPFFVLRTSSLANGYDPQAVLDATKVGPDNNDKAKDPKQAIKDFLGASLTIITLLAVGMLIYSGVLFATAAGDDSKIQKAQKTATYAIVGLAVAFLAGLIVRYILQNVLDVKE